jgi:hypothetical protein
MSGLIRHSRNGPSSVRLERASGIGIERHYIAPGEPMQNGVAESVACSGKICRILGAEGRAGAHQGRLA